MIWKVYFRERYICGKYNTGVDPLLCRYDKCSRLNSSSSITKFVVKLIVAISQVIRGKKNLKTTYLSHLGFPSTTLVFMNSWIKHSQYSCFDKWQRQIVDYMRCRFFPRNSSIFNFQELFWNSAWNYVFKVLLFF